jgi:uncharacterized protein (TIGR02284 family)
MAENDKAVSMLNSLIETCKDGEKGFKAAAEGLKSSEIKAKFLECSRERGQMVTELQAEVRRLGGDPENAGSMSGSVHRGWLDLKAALTGHDDHAIVAEAERGEDVAKAAYETALKGNLPPSAQTLVQQQSIKVRRAHDEVRDIRDNRTVTK